ncbi:hypothetical protein ACGK9R_08455 [Halomonas sp. HNIBRBA4712]|uniref:hypothetical protein n=1 Tax=Halomonas sp. HNIBRBA4712 TaxID=3373087 RepID=UPI0037457724
MLLAVLGASGALLWWLLVLGLDRSPYHCALGFGGMACSDALSAFGAAVVLLGWIGVVIGTLVVGVGVYWQRLIALS